MDCSCGHSTTMHESKARWFRFDGTFNPDIAGKTITFVYSFCLGDEIGPCVAPRHELDTDG